VIKFPEIRGGRGFSSELLLWFEDNLVITANSKNNEIALEYLKFVSQRLGSYIWEMGVGIPAQRITPQLNGCELSLKLFQFSTEATMVSGRVPGLDYGRTTVFQREHEELMRLLCSLSITPEEFARRLDAAAELDSIF